MTKTNYAQQDQEEKKPLEHAAGYTDKEGRSTILDIARPSIFCGLSDGWEVYNDEQ